jgi:hypothetical protein
MGKSSTKYKVGDYLIYKSRVNGIKDTIVRVLDYTRLGRETGRIPIDWLNGSWYMCPIRALRRPTKDEMLAWQLDQL